MTDILDPDDMTAIKSRLGPLLDDLHQTMLDVDAAPIFMLSNDVPRLAEVRGRAKHVLAEWAGADPEIVKGIYDRLYDVLREPSVPESLLVAVMFSVYADFPMELFNTPSLDSRVFAAAPNLAPLLDESGLVTVAGLDARPFGLHVGDYAFHYHQLLRRNFASNIHYELIGKVLYLAKRHDLTARLALDERRLRYKDEYAEYFESDRWYGRPLTEESLDDLGAVAETFHADPHGGTSFLHPYTGLSVRWTADGTLKGVEIEEFMPPPAPDAKWVFARYLHAIRDTEKKAFIHCDGAVKAFDASNYPTTQAGFKSRGKGDRYRKLFRVDGEFPASAWSELACSWFRGNQLILEYFGPKT